MLLASGMKVAADKRSGHGMFNSPKRGKGLTSKFNSSPNNESNEEKEVRWWGVGVLMAKIVSGVINGNKNAMSWSSVIDAATKTIKEYLSKPSIL